MRALGDLRLSIAEVPVTAGHRVLTAGSKRDLAVEPLVRTYNVEPAPPSLADLRADDRRVVEELAATHGVRCTSVDSECARLIPAFMRTQDWRAAALVRGTELIGMKPVGKSVLGLAVDLGTTGLAASLFDLADGTIRASKGELNPQQRYGADIITRIDGARRSPERAGELKHVVIEAISRMAQELAASAGGSAEGISDLVVVGNTAMHHLFLGLPLDQLARAPHIPSVGSHVEVKARELGLKLHPGAYTYFPPNPAAFIGSDHIAMLLAAGAHETDEPSLYMDIGTNTEICLLAGERMTSVSCASGPAFEGVHLSSGMGAVPGAIERLTLSNGCVQVQTIDGDAPRGLCGSGILDLCSELLLHGLMEPSGRLCTTQDVLKPLETETGFIVLDQGELGAERPITIHQRDIRNVQLAKAAIQAGTMLLLQSEGLTWNDLSQVVVAGAFGNYLNLQSARRLGLLPPVPLERIVQVGNAAGAGAGMMLLSPSCRDQAEQIARSLRYLELAREPDFQRIFLKSIALGHYEE